MLAESQNKTPAASNAKTNEADWKLQTKNNTEKKNEISFFAFARFGFHSAFAFVVFCDISISLFFFLLFSLFLAQSLQLKFVMQHQQRQQSLCVMPYVLTFIWNDQCPTPHSYSFLFQLLLFFIFFLFCSTTLQQKEYVAATHSHAPKINAKYTLQVKQIIFFSSFSPSLVALFFRGRIGTHWRTHQKFSALTHSLTSESQRKRQGRYPTEMWEPNGWVCLNTESGWNTD